MFIPAGGAAVVPTPTYAMYRVLTEQRRATVVAVPRLGARAGWALDLAAVREAAAHDEASVVWLCSPNNPTALAEPDGTIAALLDGPRRRCRRGRPRGPRRRPRRGLCRVRRVVADRPARRYPNLIVVRTASKAYALAGLRVGFAIARPELIARLNPFRPPGSVSTVSVTLVTEALRDPDDPRRPTSSASSRERARLTDALRAIGWSVGPSVTNFILVDFGSRGTRRGRRRGAAVAAASCRGRSARATRWPTTCA